MKSFNGDALCFFGAEEKHDIFDITGSRKQCKEVYARLDEETRMETPINFSQLYCTLKRDYDSNYSL